MPETVFTPEELTGRSRTHIVELEEPPCSLHREVVAPFLRLRAAAAEAGIDLVPVSSFRDFGRQARIWNAKCRGERELLDREGQVMDFAALDERGLVEAILHWSSLPGASRHHWGTDFDVIDAAAVPEGYRPQLVTSEYAPGGVFDLLNQWLQVHAHRFGFYWPYSTDRGGYQPEPWHLSYAPLAQQALQGMSVEMLRSALAAAGIDAMDTVNRQLPEIFARYVVNVDAPPATQLAV
jgi:LAS superfamily LD-carboxypeptidase LdcB